MALRVVVIGATGVFGSRVAQRLARDARFELVLAGRRRDALEAMRASYEDPSVRIATLDTGDAGFAAALPSLQPQLVRGGAGAAGLDPQSCRLRAQTAAFQRTVSTLRFLCAAHGRRNVRVSQSMSSRPR